MGGSGGGDPSTEEKNEVTSKGPIVVSAAVHVSSNEAGVQLERTSSSTSVEERISPLSSNQQITQTVSPVNYSTSSLSKNSSTAASNQSKALEVNPSQSSKIATLATVVVTAPPQSNTSST